MGDVWNFSRKLPQQVDGQHLFGCRNAVGRSELSHGVTTPDLGLTAFLSSASHCKMRYHEAPGKDIPCIHACICYLFVVVY